jgi:hypothetical protein
MLRYARSAAVLGSAGLVAVACGRLGFDALPGAGAGDASPVPDSRPGDDGAVFAVLPCSPGEQLTAHPSRQALRLTELADGKILATGGSVDGSTAVAWAELLDPETLTWRRTTDMPFAAGEHTATYVPELDAVLVTGGGDDFQDPSQSAALFDGRSEQWSMLPGMAVARIRHRATRLPGGQILVCGAWYDGAESRCERWSPEAGFSFTSAKPAAGYDHSQQLLGDGRVIAYGGGGSGQTSLYDPAADAWQDATSGPVIGEATISTMLRDGRLFVVGGWWGNPGSSAAIYDAAADTWFDAATSPRAMFSTTDERAVTLADGRVLVGGALTYDPAMDQWSDSGGELLDTCIPWRRRGGVLCLSESAARSTLLCPE